MRAFAGESMRSSTLSTSSAFSLPKAACQSATNCGAETEGRSASDVARYERCGEMWGDGAYRLVQPADELVAVEEDL